MSPWWTLLGMGLVTFGVRVIPLLAVERMPIPARARDALAYVPIAVLSAIIAQEVLAPGDHVSLSLSNDRLLAATAAILIAWRTKNILATIAGGMLLLWLLAQFN